MMGKRLAFLVFVSLFIPACGSTKHKLRDTDAEFSGRVGNDRREDIVAILGLPTQQAIVGDVEVWVYRSNEVGKVRRVPFAGGNAYLTCDELVLTFDKKFGILRTYKANLNKTK